MTTINERLLFFIKEIAKSKSLRGFDTEIGVAENHTNSIVGKKQNIPNGIYFQKLKAKYPLLSLDWLISGEGDMFKSEHNKDIESILENQKVLESENNNLKMQLNGLLNVVSVASMNQHVNFQPVSNKKTPAKKRGTVTQLPLFARSVANSTWLRAL